MFRSFTRFVLLLVPSMASQVSVTAPLPGVAMRLAGVVGLPVGPGVTVTEEDGSLFPQPVVAVQPFTARTWKVYSVPSVRLLMV